MACSGEQGLPAGGLVAPVGVVVLGGRLVLSRGRPGTPAIGPVRVTGRGEPAPDRDAGAQAPAAAPSAMASYGGVESPSLPATAAAAEVAAQRGDGKDAKEDEGQSAGKSAKGGEAQTALADARATEGSLGCDAALPKYDDVAVRFSGTSQAADAMWAAASCHRGWAP